MGGRVGQWLLGWKLLAPAILLSGFETALKILAALGTLFPEEVFCVHYPFLYTNIPKNNLKSHPNLYPPSRLCSELLV